MPLRVLNYCVQVWLRWRNRQQEEPRLPLIVPLVLYQGAEPWPYDREFAELFADVAPDWRWVPRFEYRLIDQTRQRPESFPGAVAARLAQVRADGSVPGGEARAAGGGHAVDGGAVPLGRIRGGGQGTWSTCWRRSPTNTGPRSSSRCGATCLVAEET